MTIASPRAAVLGQRARQAGLAVFDRAAFKKPTDAVQFFRDMRALGALIRSQAYDVIHVHGSEDSWTVAATLKAYGLPPRVLMTRHNSKPVHFNAPNRWLYRSAIHALVAVSAGTAENYQRFFDARVLRKESIRVIHSCIDIDRFSGALAPERVRAELGVHPDDPIVGLIGRVNREKGHMVLLDAVPEVLAVFPRAVFVFAGRGGRMEGIVRSAIAERGLQRSVRMLGFREDIPDITAALDVSVLPAVGTDSSPAVLKEAMFLGKPVIATRIGGIPEIVTEDAGVLVPPGDAKSLARALVAVLKNLRDAPSRVRRSFPERFTPEYMCTEYLKVYQNMLDGKVD